MYVSCKYFQPLKEETEKATKCNHFIHNHPVAKNTPYPPTNPYHSPNIRGKQRRPPQHSPCLRAGDGAQVLIVHRYDVVAHVDAPVLTHGARRADSFHLATGACF